MRIRKHAKISTLLYATSSLKAGALIQTHVCQLNQSPWDVMTFSPPSSPPPSQADESAIRGGNESTGHCVPVPKRELASRRPSESSATTPKAEEAPPPPPENEATVLCCKTDGKSWQCRREAADGNSLCQHHISLVRSYSNVGHHHASKKSVKPAAEAAEAPRRSRPKKAPAVSTTNPYEFYYYSGFGPRWGKRRGENRKDNSSSVPKSVEEEAAAASISLIGIDDFEFEEFEDEDEEEMGRDNGKKRVRKPIKARSLKSLL